MAVKGRCARLAHMVKTEIRENPVRYSQDNIHHLDGAVKKLESKCIVITIHFAFLLHVSCLVYIISVDSYGDLQQVG